MQIDKFKHDFKRLNGVFFEGDWVLFRVPLQLYNLKTEETIDFESLEEALNYNLNGKTLEKQVSSLFTKVRKAVCAVAEALYQIDLQRRATAAQQAADGSYRGAIASISSGRESISYTVNTASASVYAAAVANENERMKLLSSIAVKYLANIPDANGVNLLYAGGVRRVSKHNYLI